MAANQAGRAATAARFVTPVKLQRTYLIADSVSMPAARAEWAVHRHRHSLSLFFVVQAAGAGLSVPAPTIPLGDARRRGAWWQWRSALLRSGVGGNRLYVQWQPGWGRGRPGFRRW